MSASGGERRQFAEMEALSRKFCRPGEGEICHASELSFTADGLNAVFTGTIVEELEGVPTTRICHLDVASRDVRVLTLGPNSDRSPKFAPSADCVAFLSDRRAIGDFQLYLLDLESHAVTEAPLVDGWLEYLQWSPSGAKILLGTASHGADRAGVQGAIPSRRPDGEAGSWAPRVLRGNEAHGRRGISIHDLATNRTDQLSMDDLNIWEAAWCGDDAVIAVASCGPAEGDWYSAKLVHIDILTGATRDLYLPSDQIGVLSASPSGRVVAMVEAVCSDRWVVAGDLKLIDPLSGRVDDVSSNGIDISHLEWLSESKLLLIGHRGFETVAAVLHAGTREVEEKWSSEDVSSYGNYYAVGAGFGNEGEFGIVTEGFAQAPEIAVVRGGRYERLRSFDLGYSEFANGLIGSAERRCWKAGDGVEIQGWLLRPRSRGPHPVVLVVHGGPVGLTRPRCLALNGLHLLALLAHGYGLFFTNPRGSGGRGREFARMVVGDLGGAETGDHLTGLDHLVQSGAADPSRLGVTGVSHGGYMTSWIITQDRRFAAAVAVAPVTNWVTEHLLSNIPDFASMFAGGGYTDLSGRYFERSPLFHAGQARTPTLTVCGGLDRCTPPAEGIQFHNALREHGVASALAIYPEEGHGIRCWPAVFDYAKRVVEWFEEHMPVTPNRT